MKRASKNVAVEAEVILFEKQIIKKKYLWLRNRRWTVDHSGTAFRWNWIKKINLSYLTRPSYQKKTKKLDSKKCSSHQKLLVFSGVSCSPSFAIFSIYTPKIHYKNDPSPFWNPKYHLSWEAEAPSVFSTAGCHPDTLPWRGICAGGWRKTVPGCDCYELWELMDASLNVS